MKYFHTIYGLGLKVQQKQRTQSPTIHSDSKKISVKKFNHKGKVGFFAQFSIVGDKMVNEKRPRLQLQSCSQNILKE